MRTNEAPRPLEPKDPHKKDGSFRVKLFGGPAHGWWVRVFPWDVADPDFKMVFPMSAGPQTYRLHIWPDDDKGRMRACMIHDSQAIPTEEA